MEFSALHQISSLRPPETLGGSASMKKPCEKEQLRESCLQFEAVLWRTVLENTKSTSLAGEGENSDPTGTYQYFFNDTVANAVSGSSGGFADSLYHQLSRHLHSSQPTSQPSTSTPA